MKADALAALRVWGVDIELAGRAYRIPPLPAADWMAALLAEEPFPLLTLLPEREQDEIDELFADGEVSLEEIVTVQRDALGAASGWDWWAADTMIRSVAAEWALVSGEMVKRGIDPARLPLGAVLNGLYAMATEGLDAIKRMQFDVALTKPPVGAMTEEEREERAAEMFAEAMAAYTPGPPRPDTG